MDLKGNERADREAKSAANRDSSSDILLPLLTDSPLPVSLAARQQELVTALRACWREIWMQSPRFEKLSRIDGSLPSSKFRCMLAGFSRVQTSTLVQLRTGHILLNLYLHRILKSDSPTCGYCKEGEELVHHYLIDCISWNYDRWFLSQKLGRASKSMASLLSTKKGVSEVLKYIGQTGRLKALPQ